MILSLVCWALVVAGQTPAPPEPPPVSDLGRFPPAADCVEEIDRWRRHLAWLHAAESLAPRQYREHYRAWQRQTRDVLGLWETLHEAHVRHGNLWDDDARCCLAALCARLGPAAYRAGRMPWCPVRWDLEPWRDE